MTPEKFSPSRSRSQKLVVKRNRELSELGIVEMPRGKVSLKQQSMQFVGAAAVPRDSIGEPTAQ